MVNKGRLRYETGTGVGLSGETHRTVVGDFGFADGTTLVGMEQEALEAEQLFTETAADWEEKTRAGKLERLRYRGLARMPEHERLAREVEHARHVGGWSSETGGGKTRTRQSVYNPRIR